jgi:hypothetical protein
MYSQKVYKDHWHKASPIDIGRKEQVGHTNPYGGGDTHCVGAIYRQNGLDIPDIMLWEELSITLGTDTLLVEAKEPASSTTIR